MSNAIVEVAAMEKASVRCSSCGKIASARWIGPMALVSIVVQLGYHILLHQSDTVGNSE